MKRFIHNYRSIRKQQYMMTSWNVAYYAFLGMIDETEYNYIRRMFQLEGQKN